ncbi:hypothetical protein SASPL_103724 [Salvia splendens]|uniref:Uncharacterized protein n=1 Tax=Salvia splendens TaxID=180675 RepID=A0A8X8YFS3_SALSN|nr:acetylajmalan esterase-like [Salvia splendens]KAG6432150.1 hypothetical protein SASPL_103724 [Salvia splendens]
MDFSVLFYVMLSISITTIFAATEETRILCPIQTLFQLGDSLSDTGNAIRLLPVGLTLPAARLPYGETFPGRPTGRWSNGRLIIDYAAMALGLPLVNPNLDKNASLLWPEQRRSMLLSFFLEGLLFLVLDHWTFNYVYFVPTSPQSVADEGF